MKKAAINHDELRRLIGVVEAARAGIPPVELVPHAEMRASVEAHRAGAKAAFERLAEREGAKVRDNWNGAQIILGGIKATSTSGPAGALSNWVRAAELKLSAEARLAAKG
ncbi:hypothetical protein [Martelella sp. FOR1707]